MKSKLNILHRKCEMILCLGLVLFMCSAWGFFGHRQINRHAVFLLPTEMMGFYKYHLEFIEEAAVNPDRRRYAVEGEAARHYLDLDRYEDHALPYYWEEALVCYGKDSLEAHGVLPWNLVRTIGSLRQAFMLKDTERILKVSADLGHYVGDAHVPLHTTSNYDGQQTGQHGLHGFWESRLPELFLKDYDFLIGRAQYVSDKNRYVWAMVWESNGMVDSVLSIEKKLFAQHGHLKFGFESRGGMTVRAVLEEYSKDYHALLNGMVERRLRCSIRCVASLWYTAWVDAGQPNLDSIRGLQPDRDVLQNRKAELETWKKRFFEPSVRPHETDFNQ